ncbi:MAG TPA: DUF1800 domain-containing protein, partial [Rhizomicrobium sp.]|nr:DUF1800 domain-containing protein [Rhizomicrobium sp.]
MREPGLKFAGLCLLAGAMTGCSSAPPPPPAYHPTAESTAPLLHKAQDIAIVNRITWGADTSSAQRAAPDVGRYLAEQLHPRIDDDLPPDAQGQIAAMEISQKSLADINIEIHALQKQAQDAKGTPTYDGLQKAYQQKFNDLAHEAAVRSLLRDLYSRNQLKEQLTWFWFNHFNVQQGKGEIRAYVGDYEESAIRAHALSHFRQLLAATLFHPAMIQYLDNQQNAADHINENYAREIMELHTMGVGSGYTQKDVQELARILTGVGLNLNGVKPKLNPKRAADYRADGLFEFNPNRHDYGDKVFLGQAIKGSGLGEVDQALDILSREPATARHVSYQLAQYFCCDTPPDSLVNAMAATFQRSDGAISQVLQTLFSAPEFRASLGRKFKDPMHYAISAVRASYGDTVVLNEQPLMNWLGRMAEPLYGHDTPDGYPLTGASWSGPGEMESRFEIARQVGLGHSGLFKLPADQKEPAPPPVIQTTRYAQAMMPGLRPSTSNALAQVKTPAD